VRAPLLPATAQIAAGSLIPSQLDRQARAGASTNGPPVKRFQFFVEAIVQHRLKAEGHYGDVVEWWEKAEASRRELRERTTELEARVNDELR